MDIGGNSTTHRARNAATARRSTNASRTAVRAVGACLRAIAGNGDLEIPFAAERPGMSGGKVRLPDSPRADERQAADPSAAMPIPSRRRRRQRTRWCIAARAGARGQQRARASRHAADRAVRSTMIRAAPGHGNGRLGRRAATVLIRRLHRGEDDDISDCATAPIEDALAMIVRERLTGEVPPAAARKLVELWRPLIEDRAGRDLDRLERVVDDQRQFAAHRPASSLLDTCAATDRAKVDGGR